MSDTAWTVEDEIEAAIKPCPRCGGKATLEGTLNDEIMCNACGFWSGDEHDDLDEAIEWWNNQPLIDALRAQLATAQQELAAFKARIVECKTCYMPVVTDKEATDNG